MNRPTVLPRRRSALGRALLTALVAALVAGASVLAATPATSAMSRAVRSTEVEVRPGALARGADPRIPWLVDQVVVEGDVRVRIPWRRAAVLGASGEEYVVQVWNQDAESRVVAVSRDGERRTVLPRVGAGEVALSRDGLHLVRWTVRSRGGLSTVVAVHDAATGERTARRTFAGAAEVLDADEDQMLIGVWDPDRTVWWNHASGASSRVSRQAGYAADIRARRLATFTGDPYRGGCSVVRDLASPSEVLSRSCEERVEAFSPDGRRVAAVALLSDGLGPTAVTVATVDGRKVARYTTRGWFGRIEWESRAALLLDAHARRGSSVVRCEGAHCERASARSRTTMP